MIEAANNLQRAALRQINAYNAVIEVEYLYDDGEDRVAVIFTAREASDVRYFEVFRFDDVTETKHRLMSYTKTTEKSDIPQDARHLFDGPPAPDPLDLTWTVTGEESMRYGSVVNFYPGTTDEEIEKVKAEIAKGDASLIGALWGGGEVTVAGVLVMANYPEYEKTWGSEVHDYWVENIDGEETGQEQPSAKPNKVTVYWVTTYEDMTSNTQLFTSREKWIEQIVKFHPVHKAIWDSDEDAEAYQTAVEGFQTEAAMKLIEDGSPILDGELVTWGEEEITC